MEKEILSVWSDTSNIKKFKPLEEDLDTDVLIIGGGLTGVLCAYLLKQNGIDCALVEADTICSGITKNTTAKITSQHGLIYDKITRKYGTDVARLYLNANETAVEMYRNLCRDIQCDFEEKSAFVYSRNNRQKLENEIAALEKIGKTVSFVEKIPLPLAVVGAVEWKGQAQFNPLKFVAGIVKGLKIYEHTFVKEIGAGVAKTDDVTIRAKKIIVATHFPFLNKHGSYYIKMYQSRSYVIAMDNAPDVGGMYIDEYEKGLSFRNYNGLLLLGGGDHRTGKKGGNWAELEAFKERNYAASTIKYRWSTQDCMTLDSIPYIGEYSKNTPDLLVATGFNKWGMTSSMVAAMLLTDMITERENPFAKAFLPSRTILHPQLIANSFETLTNFASFSTKRCPHLGCALKWNPYENSWDCPCHGSRFTHDGLLIDNPATGNTFIQ